MTLEKIAPALPKSRLYLTTALAYANADLHLGHGVEAIIADIFARYRRGCGQEVVFLGGDDCHGTPVEIKAAAENVSPEDLIEEIGRRHKADYAKANISYLDYHLTHSPENHAICLEFFAALRDGGHLDRRTVSQLYDPEARRFLDDRRVRGTCPSCGRPDQYGDSCDCGATYDATDLKNPVSTLTGARPVTAEAEHLFFNLRPFAQDIEDWIASGAVQDQVAAKLREWVFGEVGAYAQSNAGDGLRDWCITRTGPYFGFAVPDESNLFFYVWMDAPLGYISALQHVLDEQGAGRSWRDDWASEETEIIHVIGKDITGFHGVFWPALLKAGNCRLPDRVQAHGFLNIDGAKMSKSRGNSVLLSDALAQIPSDALRYAIAARIGNGVADINLNADGLAEKVNSDLVGKIANIALRLRPLLEPLGNRLAEALPDPQSYDDCLAKAHQVLDAFEAFDLARAVRGIVSIADNANRDIARAAPWVDPDDERVRATATQALSHLRVIAALLAPITPTFARRLLAIFGETSLGWEELITAPTGALVRIPGRLFDRIKPETLTCLKGSSDMEVSQ